VLDATREGAASRLRAVLMTAAMIFGMLPMAIGFGEGGAQSAPLGRAVIGGLLVSTFATLDDSAFYLRHLAAQGEHYVAVAESDGSGSRYYEAS
jgi:Cu/Ag efflux pump CusA